MMTTFYTSPFVQALGWMLVHSIWQITLIGILLWMLLNFFGKKSPQISNTLSVSALFLICALTSWTFFHYLDFPSTVLENSSSEISSTANGSQEIPNDTLTLEESIIPNSTASSSPKAKWTLESFFPFFTIIWIVGVLFFGIRFLVGWRQIRVLKNSKIPLPALHWQNQMTQLAQKMGVQKTVQFFLSEKIQSPVTFGHFKPIILFPVSMISGLTSSQIEMLLLHELAHIRRADFLVNIIQSILEVILFYHPVVWWISKQVKTTREYCCDDLAIAICEDHFAYAETLTQIQSSIFLPQKTLVISAQGTEGTFTHRIQRLFQPTDAPPNFIKGIFSFVLIGCCLFVLAFQNPIFDNNIHTYSNDGMLYVVTPEKIELQLVKIKRALQLQNIKLESHVHYNQDKSKVRNFHGKIIMPDSSSLKFNATDLKFLAISIDWSRRNLLSILMDGKSKGTSFSPGLNGSNQAAAFMPYSAFDLNPCYLDDISVGKLSRQSSPKLYLNDLNRRTPLFILDGKKISAEELEAMEIPPTDIFSIQKLLPEDAAKKYASEKIIDGVYEITTRRNAASSFKILDRKTDCNRKILWGNRAFSGREIRLTVAEFLELKDEKIRLDYCGEIYELNSFSLSTQKSFPSRSLYTQVVEDYTQVVWSEKVKRFFEIPPFVQSIKFANIETQDEMVEPISFVVGDFKRQPSFINNPEKSKDLDIGYRSVLYDIESIYFHQSPKRFWKNHEFYLNEKKLEKPIYKTVPDEINELEKIDSIIFLAGKQAKIIFPDSEVDSIWMVYAGFNPLKEPNLFFQNKKK